MKGATGRILYAAVGSIVCHLRQPTYVICHASPPLEYGTARRPRWLPRTAGFVLPANRHARARYALTKAREGALDPMPHARFRTAYRTPRLHLNTIAHFWSLCQGCRWQDTHYCRTIGALLRSRTDFKLSLYSGGTTAALLYSSVLRSLPLCTKHYANNVMCSTSNRASTFSRRCDNKGRPGSFQGRNIGRTLCQAGISALRGVRSRWNGGWKRRKWGNLGAILVQWKREVREALWDGWTGCRNTVTFTLIYSLSSRSTGRHGCAADVEPLRIRDVSDHDQCG